MSEAILGVAKAVAEPFKSLVVDKIGEYLKFIKNYDDNMSNLLRQLNVLCAKKLDIDAKVMEGNGRSRVMTRETVNWLQSLQELIETEDMKKLLKDDRVAEIVVKMIEQRSMKRFLKEDRETFDIIIGVVKRKRDKPVRDGEVVDAQENADYKKIAEIAQEVMKDTVEEFKKYIKESGGAVAAVKLLTNDDLEKLKKTDDEMASILTNVEEISRKELEHNDRDKDGDQLVDNTQGKFGSWYKSIGTLMKFLSDENFKESVPDSVKLGLEVMDAFTKSTGYEKTEENAKQHEYCGCCVVRYNGYRHRHDMSKIAETMAKEIKVMTDGCPSGRVTRLKRADELETVSSGFTVGLESREKLIQNILTVLRDDRVNVIGIHGMGGAGKTTLVKELAYRRATDLFDKRIVVEVSEAPNIKAIQDQIAEGTNSSLEGVHTINERARRLNDMLKSEKKILIILDNIWKKLNLDDVGIPRERCKLLITTREKQVCRVMGVEDANIFEAGLLSNPEALRLFENQVGKEVGGEGYKPVVDRLLKKCGGLPLAIVATASVLRGKDLSIWCQFADESEKPISSQVSSEYHETYSILETSFKLMDNKEKRKFFFLACLSPLDSAVSVNDLMRYGIGLDLFQRVDKLSEAMKQATEWANELVSSSLLLKGGVDGKVKIHDVVRASAISFVEKGEDRMMLVESIPRWMRKETFKKFTAVSLLSGRDFSRLSGVSAPLLETLLLKGHTTSTTLASEFFGGMMNLKVLSLSNINFELGLPESMRQLERLQTLHLHDCVLKDIKLIGKLANLLVLSLCRSTLEELPAEIGELCNLQLLDLGHCKGRINIHGNILSRLSYLEGLYMSKSFIDWAAKNTEADDGGADNKARVSELNKLCHLNVLEMEVPEAEQLSTLSDGKLIEQLEEFRISVGRSNFSYSPTITNFSFQPDVQAFRYVLNLNGIDASQTTFLEALLKRTVFLHVRSSGSLTKNIVPQFDVEGFKDLNCLIVQICNGIKFIISPNNQNESSAFVNLEILALEIMEELELICDWKAPSRSFSNLRYLGLYILPKLTVGVPVTVLPLNLVEVSIRRCEKLKFIIVENASVPSQEKAVAKKKTNIIEFQFLKSMDLTNVDSLSSVLGPAENIDGEQAAQPFFHEKCVFPSLESLQLSYNFTIVTLWGKACHVPSFQNLKHINICSCMELQSLGSPSVFASLVRLENLSINSCDKLRVIITKETEVYEVREHIITFPRLQHLDIWSTLNLERFYGGSYKLEFPILETLFLCDTRTMTNFVGSGNSTALFCDKIEFPCLKKLTVWGGLDGVERLWDRSSSGVQGENVNGTVSLNPFPNSLESLGIKGFENLKAIIMDMLVGDGEDRVYVFPRLKWLKLILLPNITSFANQHSAALRFPSLETVYMGSCAEFQTFCSGPFEAPQLKQVELQSCHAMHFFVSENLDNIQELPSLESVEITDCPMLLSFSCQPLVAPKLREVILKGCPKLKWFSPRDPKSDDILELPSLEIVYIEKCSAMQSLFPGRIKAPKLRQVRLDGVIYDGRSNEELQHLLQNLPKCTTTTSEIEENVGDVE